ncbi:MAG: ATP-binding protein [Luteimonas sp.]
MSPIAWMPIGELAFAILLGCWACGYWRARQRQRAHARQALLDRSDFFATLGHEVRTAMTGVLGMSELLLDSVLDPRQRRHVAAINHAGHHLLRLVDDALDLARIEAGRLPLEIRPFELRVLLREVAELQAPLARRRGLRFVGGIAADVPVALSGDALRVKQILFNLLGNAIKFTEQGEVGMRVESLSTAAAGVRIVVHDTGPGLDAAQQARLFRRFEQCHSACAGGDHRGSGLGLAISQELAMAMGGRIVVDSAPGAGTRFSVELPLPAAIIAKARAAAAN